MASGLLSLLNGGGGSNTSTSASPAQTPLPATPPPPATTIDQLFARLNSGSASSPLNSPGPSLLNNSNNPNLSRNQSPFHTPTTAMNGNNGPNHQITPTQHPIPQSSSNSHHLLGLLSSGSKPTVDSDIVHQSGNVAPLGVIGSPRPSLSEGMGSGMGVPSAVKSPPLKEDRAQNLLAALMGGGTPIPPTPTSPPRNLAQTHQQPIIDHNSSPYQPLSSPTAPPSADQLPPPRIKSPEPTSSTLPSFPTDLLPKETTEDSAPSNSTAPTDPPKKSIFSFVSPFDAFDEPSRKVSASTPQPGTPSPAPGGPAAAKKAAKKEKEKAKVESSSGSEVKKEEEEMNTSATQKKAESKTASQVENAPSPKVVNKQIPMPKSQLATPSMSKITSSPSATASATPATSSPSKRRAAPINVPFAADQFPNSAKKAHKVQEVNGTYVAIDVSQANASSIAKDLRGISHRKISLITTDADTVGAVANHQTISVAGDILAYALMKAGRIRILDPSSGLNTLVEFPADSEGNVQKVVDIAVSPDHYCAAVSLQGWVAVWQINIREATEATPAGISCDLIATRQASGFGQKAENVSFDSDNQTLLVMVGGHSISRLAFSLGDANLKTLHEYSSVDSQADYVDIIDLVDFSRNASGSLAVLYSNGTVKIWSTPSATRSQDLRLQSHNNGQPCSSIEFAGDHVLVGYGGGRSYVYCQQDGGDSPLFFNFMGTKSLPAETGLGIACYDQDKKVFYISCYLRASIYVVSIQDYSQETQGWKVRYLEIPVDAIGSMAVQNLSTKNSGESHLFYKYPKGFSQAVIRESFLKALIGPPTPAAAPAPKATTAPTIASAPTPKAAIDPPAAQSTTPTAAPTLNSVAPQAASNLSKAAEPEPTPRAATPPSPAAPVEQIKVKVEDTDEEEGPKAATSTSDAQPAPPAVAPEISEAQLTQLEERLSARIGDAISDQIKASGVAQIAEMEKIQHQGQAADIERQANVMRLISEALDRGVKTALANTIQQEIQNNVLPVMTQTIQASVESVVGPKLISTVNNNIQDTVMTEVERILIPHLAKTFNAVLSPIVEKRVQIMIEKDLIPKYVEATRSAHSEMTATLSQELSSLRQAHLDQLNVRPSPDPAIQQLVTQISQMNEQLRSLSTEVQALKNRPIPIAPAPTPTSGPLRSPMLPGMHPGAYPPPPHSHAGIPPIGSASGPGSHPHHHQPFSQFLLHSPPPPTQSAPAPPPIREDAEETFLSAFGTMTDEGLLQFVMERQSQTGYLLPNPVQGKSPLSQAVLLSIIHRLSKLLEGQSPAGVVFQICLTWIFRAANLIDPKDASISSYLPQIRDALFTQFRSISAQMSANSNNLNGQPGQDAQGQKQAALQTMNSVMGLMSRS